MMNKRLYKTYVKLSNIVMRISNGTSEGKEHAILVNSHLDSTLPSPGAADDAISVGVSFFPPFFFTLSSVFVFVPILIVWLALDR
jgi:Zn-dependent M28 family amino/carboxypeptidase